MGLLDGFSRSAFGTPLDPAERRAIAKLRTAPESLERDSDVPEAFPQELRWGHDRSVRIAPEGVARHLAMPEALPLKDMRWGHGRRDFS